MNRVINPRMEPLERAREALETTKIKKNTFERKFKHSTGTKMNVTLILSRATNTTHVYRNSI